MDLILKKIGTTNEIQREIYEKFVDLVQAQICGSGPGGTWQGVETMTWLMTTPLDYVAVDTLACHLTLQLNYLEKTKGQTLLFWQPQDILVVGLSTNSSTDSQTRPMYLLANLTQLVPLSPQAPEQLVLTYPATYPFPAAYCAPELLALTELPFRTHKSASYYSLALLCLHMLNLSLAELKGTKLFYFLERCLKERVLLYL